MRESVFVEQDSPGSQLARGPGGVGLGLNYVGCEPAQSTGALRPRGRAWEPQARDMLWARRVTSVLASGNPRTWGQWRMS